MVTHHPTNHKNLLNESTNVETSINKLLMQTGHRCFSAMYNYGATGIIYYS